MLDKKIESMQDEIIKAISESVQIKSVEGSAEKDAPFGTGPKQSLDHTLALAEKLGFRAVNLDNKIGYAEFGQGAEMIAVLGHLDVVPEGDGWTYPPYGGEVHDGIIYGRGVVDNKGPVIGALYALYAIKELGLSLSRRVRVIFGTNEESGFGCAAHYVENEEHPVAGFTPDADYPIIHAEKGIFSAYYKKAIGSGGSLQLVELTGGTALNVVPPEASAVLTAADTGKTVAEIKAIVAANSWDYIDVAEDAGKVRITAHGESAHASVPHLGKNAITRLMAVLAELDIQAGAREVARSITTLLHNDTEGRGVGVALEDAVSGKLTLNLGVISIENGMIAFGINIRYPVTKGYDDIAPVLHGAFAAEGIEMTSESDTEPLYIPEDAPLIQKLLGVYHEKTGLPPELLAIGGGTYAKSMKNLVAFGPILPGVEANIHQPDEHISIEHLMLSIKIMAQSIYELAN